MVIAIYLYFKIFKFIIQGLVFSSLGSLTLSRGKTSVRFMSSFLALGFIYQPSRDETLFFFSDFPLSM